ncbi:MAG: CDP-alcohol phosphatidyltransferase family protein [Bacteroidales bacterium]|nr:CDP-alcohol phosphatidyltransferase family protein [Bacteroidales bacterium]
MVTQSRRIQTSILNGPEKKALNWLAARQPAWVTSDMLTCLGALGALLVGLGFALSGKNINFLWLATFGLLVNWYGDSLDGTLARYRNTQRPTYGFFVDHMIDCFSEVVIFVGFGISTLVHFNLAMLVLVCYLLLSIYVYISAHLKGEFKLTYAKLGPTEFRAMGAIVNTVLIYVTAIREFRLDVNLLGHDCSLTLFDLVAIVMIVVLLGFLVTNFFKDAKMYAKNEPRIKNGKRG